MYLNHYHLNLKPFEMSPDPQFLWLGEKHKEALATLEYGVLESKGILLLTGDTGAGKTLLLNALAKSAKVQPIIATIPDPDLYILDFFNFLSEEFQINKNFETKGAFLIEFKHFLSEVYKADGKVLLIIDEAQRLNHDLLEQVRILSNLEDDYKKLINIFIAGQSELNQILREERNIAFRKRIAVSYHLDPLDEIETAKYIHHRLNVAGADQEIFNPEAVREIFTFSMGCPRLINIICDHALLIGYAKGIKLIEDSVIAVCKQDLHILSEPNKLPEEGNDFEQIEIGYEFGEPSDKGPGRKRNWVYASVALAFLLIGYTLLNFMWKDLFSINIAERQQSLNNSFSQKESQNAKHVKEGDFDKGKVALNLQMEDTVSRSKTNLAKKETVLSTDSGDKQAATVTSSENNISLVRRKTIIQFEHDSMQLPDEAYGLLDQVVKLSTSKPVSEIIVKGYTDSYGDYRYNQNLSKSRADVIKKYLVKVGIPETKIKTFGMGPINPIASNNTSEGRKQNRRIEITIKAK